MNKRHPVNPDDRRQLPRTGGFTVLEVVIVLAIAGLILLIVLQAIPTLQRNGHNNRRKQDVAAILAAVSRWELNNSGSMPTTDEFLKAANLSYYSKTPFAFGSKPVQGIGFIFPDRMDPAGESNPNEGSVWLYNRRKCDLDSPGKASKRGAGYNDVVALYAVETSPTTTGIQCQQL